jgi:hypothetical protein
MAYPYNHDSYGIILDQNDLCSMVVVVMLMTWTIGDGWYKL